MLTKIKIARDEHSIRNLLVRLAKINSLKIESLFWSRFLKSLFAKKQSFGLTFVLLVMQFHTLVKKSNLYLKPVCFDLFLTFFLNK